MAYDLPITTPLTDVQAELTAKISAIKSLLALPIFPSRNIPKIEQISTFDYLMRITESLGLPVEPIFTEYINTVFSEQNIFLEEAVLKAYAYALAKRGRLLSSNNFIINPNLTQQIQLEDQNFALLKSQFGGLYLANDKESISKALIFSIFGGADTAAGAALVSDPAERARLIDGAICGDEVFSVSVDPVIRNEDIEFNRIKLRQQLEKGEVELEISCQKVKLTLPEDPGFFFIGGGTQTIPGAPGNNAQAISSLVTHVENNVQEINNPSNAASGGKAFYQILIEKLLSNVTTLVAEPSIPVFNYIASQPGANGLSFDDFFPSTCSIAENCDSPTAEVDYAFAFEISNEMYRELTSTMLIVVIKNFKQFAVNYLKRLAIERALRKAEKLKARFAIAAQLVNLTSNLDKYTAALQSLSSIVPNITTIEFEE